MNPSKKTRTLELDAACVRVAIVELFLKRGRDHTADHLGWTGAKVRRSIRLGKPIGIISRTGERPTYSRHFTGFEHGVHRVTEYGPSRDLLRNLIAVRFEQIDRLLEDLKDGQA